MLGLDNFSLKQSSEDWDKNFPNIYKRFSLAKKEVYNQTLVCIWLVDGIAESDVKKSGPRKFSAVTFVT